MTLYKLGCNIIQIWQFLSDQILRWPVESLATCVLPRVALTLKNVTLLIYDSDCLYSQPCDKFLVNHLRLKLSPVAWSTLLVLLWQKCVPWFELVEMNSSRLSVCLRVRIMRFSRSLLCKRTSKVFSMESRPRFAAPSCLLYCVKQ